MSRSIRDPSELSKADVLELYDMLGTMRPHDSAAEQDFTQRFIDPLGAVCDDFGNRYVRIGTAPIMWSSHVDTVHHRGGTQNVTRDDKFIIRLSRGSSGCLGADDTAGVWLMTQMIQADVPGLYVFHRGEEVGCKGSEWLLKNNPSILEGIKCVIALDRRGMDNVITFQRGYRCCSDDFGTSLADQINGATKWPWKNGKGHYELKYKNDTTGVYTDSAVYVDKVGECTNLSVGYYDQHTARETLDLDHIIRLRECLIKMDLGKLVYKRKAGDKESRWGNAGGGGHYYYGGRPYNSFSDPPIYDDDGIEIKWGHPEYYLASFKFGHWAPNPKEPANWKREQWINLTEEEWKVWRLKEYARIGRKPRDLEAKPNAISAVKKFEPTLVWKKGEGRSKEVFNPLSDREAMLAVVKANAIQVTDLLISYGIDVDMLKEAMWEAYASQDKKGSKDEKKDKDTTPATVTTSVSESEPTIASGPPSDEVHPPPDKLQ